MRSPLRNLLIAALFCAGVAWLAGPAGRFGVVLALLLFGPGYLLERLLPAAAPLPAFVRPTLWLGLSLSVIALLYQWATALSLALLPPVLGLLAALCGLGVVWAAWRDLGGGLPGATIGRAWAALLAIFGLTLWTRFVQIRDLALPVWVDSVHHALLIRVAAERGQAPITLQPYLPVDDLPYHWGYHVITAAVMQLSGVELPQAMLWSGQIFNALHVLTCAALASYLWRHPLAGAAAGIVVGLISIMPAYYVSWGRYTQLVGLLLLPPLAIVWQAGLRAPSRRWLLLGAVLLAGLSLIHFRVLVFALALLAALSLVWALAEGWAAVRARLGSALLSAGLALALTLPWLALLLEQRLRPAVERPQTLVGGGNYNALNLNLLWAGENRLLVALALVAAFWALWRRSRVAGGQIGWLAGLALLANPWLAGFALPAAGALLALWGARRRRWLALPAGGALLLLNPALVRLPYLWLITNDVVVISLFIPLGVLIGGGVCLLWGALRQALPPVGRRAAQWSGALLLALAALWGASNLRDVINPTTMLATGADAAAIAWAVEHTPVDARFLVNSRGWLPDANRSDGGWWLLPLAGRWVSTPPVIYIYGPPDYVRAVQEVNRQVAGFRPGQEQELYRLIRREGISHIYLSDRAGALTLESFPAEAGFVPVYDRAGVTILAVYPQP